jgi:hypothetical protein
LILDFLDTVSLETYAAERKKAFEEAFAGGRPYEEVNALYQEFRALQGALSRRMAARRAEEEKGAIGPAA